MYTHPDDGNAYFYLEEVVAQPDSLDTEEVGEHRVKAVGDIREHGGVGVVAVGHKGEIQRRINGSMIALEGGTAYAYAINNLQDRGSFFIDPQTEVYAGQVVGEHVHENDLVVNVCKAKQLTNMRASGSDEKVRIIPPIVFSLEEALEYIKEDEYVEVTPKSMRLRKIILDHLERKRANR